jgi:hypothetical protein
MDGQDAVATFPTLCDHLSRFDGRTASSLRVVGMALRDAGLMSVGNFGRGATHVSPEDAAALVMAGLWTDSPCASARAVELLSTLKHRPAPKADWAPRHLFLISEFLTFGEALAALIEYGPMIRRQLEGFSLEVTVRRPVPVATMRLRDSLNRQRVVREWIVDGTRLMDGFYRPEMAQAVDRQHATTVTGATLFALGDLIQPLAERVSA